MERILGEEDTGTEPAVLSLCARKVFHNKTLRLVSWLSSANACYEVMRTQVHVPSTYVMVMVCAWNPSSGRQRWMDPRSSWVGQPSRIDERHRLKEIRQREGKALSVLSRPSSALTHVAHKHIQLTHIKSYPGMRNKDSRGHAIPWSGPAPL